MRKLRYNLSITYWEKDNDDEPVRVSFTFKGLEDALKMLKGVKKKVSYIYMVEEEYLSNNIEDDWDPTGKFWDHEEVKNLFKKNN